VVNFALCAILFAFAQTTTGIATTSEPIVSHRRIDEPARAFTFKGEGKSIEIVDSTIGAIRLSGNWKEPIRLAGTHILGECTVVGLKCPTLVISDCTLDHGLTLDDVDIGRVVIVSPHCVNHGIRLASSRIDNLDVINPTSEPWRRFSEPFVTERFALIWDVNREIANISTARYDALTIEQCVVRERLAIGGDLLVPAVLVADTRIGSLYVSNRANALGAIEFRRLTIRQRMGIDLQSLPVRLVVEDCVVEEGETRFSSWKNRFNASTVRFDGSAFTFDESPSAGEIAERLPQGDGSRDERLRLLQKLKRFYVETGQGTKARIIAEHVARESLAKSTIQEKLGLWLDWMSSGKSVFSRLLFSWFMGWLFTFLILVGAASCGVKIGHDSSAYQSSVWRSQTLCALRCSLASVCPVPVDDDMVLTSFAFVIHALCRIYVWMLILLCARALAGF
jgi:hypothetical protein